MKLDVTPFDLAQRYVGLVMEQAGGVDHPLIQWWLSLSGVLSLDQPDETPWCSGFLNGIFWELRLPRSKSPRARSWLTVGQAIEEPRAVVGFDVVVLQRGSGSQPGPGVIEAPGHVGLFAGYQGSDVLLLGGNQENGVTVAPFSRLRILGVRRVLV